MSRPARFSSVARAGFAEGDEFECRMAVRLGDEIPYRGVLARLEVRPRGRGDTNVTLQDRPCLCRRELPEGVVVPVTAASEPDLPGGARIEHPRHGAVRGDQPPLLALHDKDHRGGAQPPGHAAACGQQMSRPDPDSGENAEDRIADPVAAALPVLAHRPGRAVPGWVHLSGEMGLIVGPALATVLVIARSGVRHDLLLWSSRSSRPRTASVEAASRQTRSCPRARHPGRDLMRSFLVMPRGAPTSGLDRGQPDRAGPAWPRWRLHGALPGATC